MRRGGQFKRNLDDQKCTTRRDRERQGIESMNDCSRKTVLKTLETTLEIKIPLKCDFGVDIRMLFWLKSHVSVEWMGLGFIIYVIYTVNIH